MTDLIVYANYNANVVRGFESWLGDSVDGIIAYADRRSWDQMVYSPLWMAEQDITMGGSKPLYWAVPLTTDGTKLEDVADGGYEGYFHTLAERIATLQPAGEITVRIGWEHNGWWYPWSSIGREADYIQAYRMAVDQFRQVSDRFVFEWNSNEAYHEDPALAYPGDDVVDIVSMTAFYNTQWSGWDGVRAFEMVRDKPFGLSWLEAFAAAHDKPTAYSEWGVTADTQGADYIELFSAWVKQHDLAADGEGVAYTGYWESNDHLPAYLQDDNYPTASEAFRAAFGPIVIREPVEIAFGSGPDVLVLRVNQDAWQGDAQYAVYVDGARVGPNFTAAALHDSGETDTLTLRGAWGAGQHQVRVDFLNDAWGGTPETDRNIFVPFASYNGVETAALAGGSGGSFVVGQAGGPAPGPVSLSAGTGPDTLVLRVNQDAWMGNAQYAVFVDDEQVGGTFTASALHASGQSDTLTLRGDWGEGQRQVRVEFLNDAWGGTPETDRNLYVLSSSYNGVEGPGVNGWNGGSLVVGEAAEPAPPPVSLSAGTGPDTLVLRVSQDAWMGNAQYAVLVDGAQVGGTFTASAWHSTGQTDTLTLRGDWTDGQHQVRVDFLNDAWGGTPETDRNLYVPGASFNGIASAALGDGWTGGSFWVG
jgi:hypothetical protein